jgi:GTP pyrophosphokinase
MAGAEADITHVDMDEGRAQDAADLRFLVAVRDRSHLETAMRAIQRIPDVLRVQRTRRSGWSHSADSNQGAG